MNIPLHLQLPRVMSPDSWRHRRWAPSLPLSSFLLFLPKAEGRTFPVLTPCPSSSPSCPREAGFESHNVVTQSAHCHCPALFKGNAVGFPCRVLDYRKVLYVFTWSSISHTFCYEYHSNLYLRLCGELFCNERSSPGDWAAFNKVYVCILPVLSLLFPAPSWGSGGSLLPLRAHDTHERCSNPPNDIGFTEYLHKIPSFRTSFHFSCLCSENRFKLP